MKQFIRNFRKQKVVGTLNIVSLALGIMVSLIVGLWSINEFTFDRFHSNYDRMYRIYFEADLNDERVSSPGTLRTIGELGADRIPDIEKNVKYHANVGTTVTVGQTDYSIRDLIVADAGFFEFFNFPLKYGDPATVLDSPDKAVIDESTAIKLFADENPVGRTLAFDGKEFTVSGIMYDMPANSHIRSGAVFPFYGHWLSTNQSDTYTNYVLLKEGADIGKVERSLTDILLYDTYYGQIMKPVNGKARLESLTDIHFSRHKMVEVAVIGNRNMVITYLLTAIVILIIACINFANLFISTSFIRAKTIGIKKSMGAGRKGLVLNFYRETLAYVLIAVVLGVVLAYAALPLFNSAVNTDLAIDFTSAGVYIFIAALIVVVALLAGTFPAITMTGYGITETLYGKFKGKSMSAIQKSLVVIQFTASIFLVITVMFFTKQIDYMLSRDLGFDRENVFFFPATGDFAGNYESLRGELLKDPSIADITQKKGMMTTWFGGSPVRAEGSDRESVMERCYVEPNYFEFFGMDIIEGENPFLLEGSRQQKVCMVNRTTADFLGYDDPLDKRIFITVENDFFTIKGVVKDAQVRSFHKPVDPQVFLALEPESTWANFIFVKTAGDPANAIQAAEKMWKQSVTDAEFGYEFLDDSYRQFYTAEMNSRKILGYALVITFIITIAGLFAMAYYSAQRRVKEIGIRKINGATMQDLMLLLNKGILLWVSISFILACPVAYFFLKEWLTGFTVRTPLSAWIFLLAGAATCTIALLTVSYQTWKTASANPVDALKSE